MMDQEVKEMVSKAAERVIVKARFFNIEATHKTLCEINAMVNLLKCMGIGIEVNWNIKDLDTKIESVTLSYNDYCTTVYA